MIELSTEVEPERELTFKPPHRKINLTLYALEVDKIS